MHEFLHFLSEFAIMFLTALFLENTVFARGFGLSRAVAMSRRPRRLFFYGILLTILTFVAGLPCYLLHVFFPDLQPAFIPICYFGCCTVGYLLFYLLTGFVRPDLRDETRKFLPVATFNCAVMGSIFLALYNGYSLWQFVAFGLGNGAGFVFATLLLLNADHVLSRTKSPKSFAGFPILLLYIGILAMAFYSLIGHQLPF